MVEPLAQQRAVRRHVGPGGRRSEHWRRSDGGGQQHADLPERKFHNISDVVSRSDDVDRVRSGATRHDLSCGSRDKGLSTSGCLVVQSVDDGITWTNVLKLDRPAYNLTVSANGILQAAQTPDPPQAYYLISDPIGNISYGTYFGAAFTQVEIHGAFRPRLRNKRVCRRHHRGWPAADGRRAACLWRRDSTGPSSSSMRRARYFWSHLPGRQRR